MNRSETEKFVLFPQMVLSWVSCLREMRTGWHRRQSLTWSRLRPTQKPPVVKIIDYGKFRYEQSRKEKEARKKQKTVEIKEVRLSPNIDTNDLNTKVNAARKFISKGDKVKVSLRFRGREMAHVQNSRHILDDLRSRLLILQ